MGHIQSFSTYELGTLVKSFNVKSNHIPSKAAPLTPDNVRTICNFIDVQPSIPLAVKPAILIAYTAMLRVSNILSPTLTSWGVPHTLQASDILHIGNALKIVIRSTKTLKGPSPVVIDILPSQDLAVCPVLAWTHYKNCVNPCPLGPAFVTSQGIPLTLQPVVTTIRIALANAGHPDPGAISFHSLRRGGVQTAIFQKASQEQVMQHGLWKSKSGLAAYLPSSSKPRIIQLRYDTQTQITSLPGHFPAVIVLMI